MAFNAKGANCPHPHMDSLALERTYIFDYLGVTLNDKMDWGSHMAKANMKLAQVSGGILRVSTGCSYKTIGPPVEIFRSQARGGALYGAELWGHLKATPLALTENSFIRRLINLPQSTPLFPLRFDLGLAPISDIIANRPLFYWRRLWSTPELISFREELRDLLTILGVGKIPWLWYVRQLCYALGRPDIWLSPEQTCPLISKNNLKQVLKDYRLAGLIQTSAIGSLTSRFLEAKVNYHLEHFMDQIQPLLAKKLYVQFRHGVLPVRDFTNKWLGAGLPPQGCPGCAASVESDLHVLLFCPFYSHARAKWIIQLCKNLGFREYREVYRILKYDTSPLIVFATSRYLHSMWCLRSDRLKTLEHMLKGTRNGGPS